jgi:hypothetical protein
MPNRPTIVALASAVAIAAAAGGALVAQGSDTPSGPATPALAVTAFVDGMAAGDPATCKLLTSEALAEALRSTPGQACEEVVEEAGRQGWMDELTVGHPTVTTSGADFAVVRYELPSADVFWFRAVRGPQGWLLQRGPWDDTQSA